MSLISGEMFTSEVGEKFVRKMPSWKVDGYCNMASANAFLRDRVPASLESRIGLLLDEEQWDDDLKKARRLFQSHLMVEFLCVVRGLDFAELIDPGITERDALRDMVAWYKQRTQSQVTPTGTI